MTEFTTNNTELFGVKRPPSRFSDWDFEEFSEKHASLDARKFRDTLVKVAKTHPIAKWWLEYLDQRHEVAKLDHAITTAKADDFIRPLAEAHGSRITGDVRETWECCSLEVGVKIWLLREHLHDLEDDDRTHFLNRFADHYAGGHPIIKEMVASFDKTYALLQWLLSRHEQQNPQRGRPCWGAEARAI